MCHIDPTRPWRKILCESKVILVPWYSDPRTVDFHDHFYEERHKTFIIGNVHSSDATSHSYGLAILPRTYALMTTEDERGCTIARLDPYCSGLTARVHSIKSYRSAQIRQCASQTRRQELVDICNGSSLGIVAMNGIQVACDQ